MKLIVVPHLRFNDGGIGIYCQIFEYYTKVDNNNNFLSQTVGLSIQI